MSASSASTIACSDFPYAFNPTVNCLALLSGITPSM